MKFRALTGKETWNGDICLVPDKTDNLEPPSYSESPLLVEVASPLVSETNLSLLESPVIKAHGPDVLKGECPFSSRPATTTPIANGSKIEVKPQHVPGEQMHSMTKEERAYTPKEL